MKNVIYFFLVSISGFAQCISGDCQNGKGKYNFGFATYEGNFKSGKPHGQGTMDYGGGDKFVGNFTNGQENGDGILYKNNIPKNARFSDGKLQIKTEQVVMGGNAPKVEDCVVGDCYNGYGEINFPSGNTLKGDFLFGQRNGKCLYTFQSGNSLNGLYKNDVLVNGVFNYQKEGITFTGTFDEKTEPKTGKFYYQSIKATVEVVNGKITKVDNPEAQKAESLLAEQKKGRMCLKCNGKGFSGGGSRFVTTENYYTIDYVRPDGNVARSSSGNVMKSTRMETSPIIECFECKGKGKVFSGNQMIISKQY